MKIAIVVTTLKNTGPVVVMRNLCAELIKKANISVDVFYFDESSENIFPTGVPTRRISLRTQIDFDNYDVVHTNMIRPDLYMLRWLICWRRAKCVWVSTIHQQTLKDLFFRFGMLKGLCVYGIWNFALLFCSVTVAVSKAVSRGYWWRKTQVIYNGIIDFQGSNDRCDPIDHEKIKCLRGKYFVLGAMGNVIRCKGFEQVVCALKKCKNCAFVLVGDGPERKNLIRLSKELGVEDRFLSLGYRTAGWRYLQTFDVYVLSSRSEGCCQAGLEANCAGLPLVMSDIAPFREIYHGDVGCFYHLDDVNQLASAIDNVLAQKVTCGKSSRKLYEKMFSATQMAMEYEKTYFDYMEEKRK